MGVTHPPPPNDGASRMDALRQFWTGAGLDAIETREITVTRTFTNFDELWTGCMGANIGRTIAAMGPDDADRLKARVRTRLAADATESITFDSRANAITGRVPR